ncbi:MAG: hypothetical protein QOG75_5809, partial [Mycobacterium sp.]|nr:hypothetical protein [Mycobacterium sp.]
MTDLQSFDRVEAVGPASAAPAEIKTLRPVLFWSSVGAVCVSVATYIYLSWILSGNATPVDPPIPGVTRLAMTAFQIACPILAVVAIVYVIRKSL